MSDYYTELMSRCPDGKMEPEVKKIIKTEILHEIVNLKEFKKMIIMIMRDFTLDFEFEGVQKDLPSCLP